MKNRYLFEKIGVVVVTLIFITAIFIPAVSSQYIKNIENDYDNMDINIDDSTKNLDIKSDFNLREMP